MVSPDVGGGFGYKGKLYPEEGIIAWAARRLRRPVRWVATRAESFVADNQGRDHLTQAELALDADGRFLALRVETLANLGAYVSTFGAAIPSAIYSALLAGGYRTPAIFVEVTGVFTNTTPTDAYPRRRPARGLLRAGAAGGRGGRQARHRPRRDPPAQPRSAGRDAVQDADRSDLRLRRLPEDFRPRAGARRLRRIRSGAAPRPRARGRLRGIGMACYVESSGVAPSRFAGALGARAGFYRGGAPSGSSRTARCAPCSAPTITVRATPPPSRRSCRRGSGVPVEQDRGGRGRHRCGALRHRHLRLALDRGRRLARSIAPPTRSSPRAS